MCCRAWWTGSDQVAAAAAAGEGARPSGSKRRAKRPSGKAASSGVVQRGVMDAFRPVDVSDVAVSLPLLTAYHDS